MNKLKIYLNKVVLKQDVEMLDMKTKIRRDENSELNGGFIMLKELVKTNKLYGYITDYYIGGKGVVLANNEQEAKEKVIRAYLKHGYSESELEELEVWKVEQEPFADALDVLEIWQ